MKSMIESENDYELSLKWSGTTQVCVLSGSIILWRYQTSLSHANHIHQNVITRQPYMIPKIHDKAYHKTIWYHESIMDQRTAMIPRIELKTALVPRYHGTMTTTVPRI
jgi:hypothetical protein